LPIVVLGKGRWTLVKHCLAEVLATVDAAMPGSFAEVDIPYDD
jgi:hypothetical protein